MSTVPMPHRFRFSLRTLFVVVTVVAVAVGWRLHRIRERMDYLQRFEYDRSLVSGDAEIPTVFQQLIGYRVPQRILYVAEPEASRAEAMFPEFDVVIIDDEILKNTEGSDGSTPVPIPESHPLPPATQL